MLNLDEAIINILNKLLSIYAHKTGKTDIS